MGLLNLTLPSIGQPNSTEDVDVVNAFSAIQTLVNGNLDATNLTAATQQQLGLTSAGRGATNIATSESRSNVAYGTLPTPDQVSNVVLPTNGLLIIGYQATWQQSTGVATAAVFIGANQLKVLGTGNGAPTVQEATFSGAGTGTDLALGTTPYGLARGTAAYSGDVTTGQVLGVGANSAVAPTDNVPGPVWVWAAAGTYTISVQFKASAGSVTAKNRRLWVLSFGF